MQATGGGDGAVRIWNTRELRFCTATEPTYSFAIPTIDDFPRVLRLVDVETIVAVSDQGHVWEVLLPAGSADSPRWNCLIKDESLASYAVLTTSACGRWVCIGDAKGGLVIFDRRKSSVVSTCLCLMVLFLILSWL